MCGFVLVPTLLIIKIFPNFLRDILTRGIISHFQNHKNVPMPAASKLSKTSYVDGGHFNCSPFTLVPGYSYITQDVTSFVTFLCWHYLSMDLVFKLQSCFLCCFKHFFQNYSGYLDCFSPQMS